MTPRAGQSGVTLIEMLVALSVFSLIGIASFSVLETIARTDRQTSGQLEDLARIDLALRLFEADVERSASDYSIEAGAVALMTAEGRVTYRSDEKGLSRKIIRPDRPDLDQRVLPPPFLAQWTMLTAGVTGKADEGVPAASAVEMRLTTGDDARGEVRKLVRLTPMNAQSE